MEPASAGTAQPELLRRIAELEGELARHKEFLLQTLTWINGEQRLGRWQEATRYFRWRNRLWPPGSRRQALAARLLRAFSRLARIQPKPPIIELRSVNDDYPRWIAENEPGPVELARQRQARFDHEPRICLVVRVSDEPSEHVAALLESLAEQTYANWQVWLNSATGVGRQINVKDSRIQTVPPGEDAWQLATAAAGNSYLALLGPADTLAPFALFEVVQALNRAPDADLIYSDEDELDGAGRRHDPCFKPDWSPDTLRSHPYFGRLMLLSGKLSERIGGLRVWTAAGEYDLCLRASEQARRIVHVSKVLYHRRGREPLEGEAAKQALAKHLGRSGENATVANGLRPGTFAVRYALPSRPLVSIVIPNRDQADVLARCLDSIDGSSYRHYEIIVVENGSRDARTFGYYDRLTADRRARLLVWKESFNFAAVNNFAVGRCSGAVLLFLNNDVSVLHADWLERMLEQALRPHVGAVGAKLYFPEADLLQPELRGGLRVRHEGSTHAPAGSIQHAGCILGVLGGVGHLHRLFPRDAAGYCNRLVVTQNLSAVTGACLMTRRDVFDEVGGFDERFVNEFNDIDLCLKIRTRGYRVVWTPHAELCHYESWTRAATPNPAKQAELEYERFLFQCKWGEAARVDPYYNPNLTLLTEDGALRLAG